MELNSFTCAKFSVKAISHKPRDEVVLKLKTQLPPPYDIPVIFNEHLTGKSAYHISKATWSNLIILHKERFIDFSFVEQALSQSLANFFLPQSISNFLN